MYQFCLADDHPLYRDALEMLLQQQWPSCSLTTAASLPELIETLSQGTEPDLLLLDVNMPGSNGLEGLTAVKQQFPDIAVVMLSAEDDKKTVLNAMALGAIGFISKSADKLQLLNAIEQLLQGNIYLPAETFKQKQPTAPLAFSEGSTLKAGFAQSMQQLTKQQNRVLQHLLAGATNKEIANALFIAETTVKAHVTAIFDKFEVKNRMQLLARANQSE